jgi:hypothetical protein
VLRHPPPRPAHTHASIALQTRIHVEVVSERLGHETVASTAWFYAATPGQFSIKHGLKDPYPLRGRATREEERRHELAERAVQF